MKYHMISWMVFLPIIGTLLQVFLPEKKSKWLALGSSLAASVAALFLVMSLGTDSADPQAGEVFAWIGSYAIRYDMAVDGFNILVVLLLALLFPVLIACEWTRAEGVKGMYSLFLLLQASLFGALCAQDLFLQFSFWGLSALPFYFLIGIWGGEGREKAAFRTMMASVVGNSLIFAALVLIYYSLEPHTFSIHEIAQGAIRQAVVPVFGTSVKVTTLACLLMCGGLALRAPVWPFHGWFIEAAEEAPPSVLVALAAGVVPVALSLFVRMSYCLFPDVLRAHAPALVLIGLTNLFMGALSAVAQKSLRTLLAHVCISELGLILMGAGSLSPEGLVGSLYQVLMLGIGLAGFGIFLSLMTDRVGSSVFIGTPGTSHKLGMQAPTIAVVAGVVVASLLGFPGFGGFVGHALIMIGGFSARPWSIFPLSLSFLLVSAALFRMYRSIFLGKAQVSGGPDVSLREQLAIVPLVILMCVCGIYPKPFIEMIRPTALTMLSLLHRDGE